MAILDEEQPQKQADAGYTPLMPRSHRRPLSLVGFLAVAVLGSLVGRPAPVSAAAATSVSRVPDSISYQVRLSSDELGHVWTGRERISFRNNGSSPLRAVWLRLWDNGVLGCTSTGDSIQVSNVQGGLAGPLETGCTAVRIALTTAVAPGAEGSVSLHVRIGVPARNDRFGYHGGIALLGNALPVLAVRDDAGWHHTEPYVSLGESFYSIVSRYRVTLTTPLALETPTTGIRVARTVLAGGRVRSTYAARQVRDFAWAAGKFSNRSTTVNGTRLVVSYLSRQFTSKRAMWSLRRAAASLRTYDAALGDYPYPEMDVVLWGDGPGGMEYPTIIFTLPPTIPHEIAHQWWYGIVGDDEYRSPWLDESFAQWSASSLVHWDWATACSPLTWQSPTDRITRGMGYWSRPGHGYTWSVYLNGPCMLHALAVRFGSHRFATILAGYAHDHWFGVTRTRDFKAVIDRAAAHDLPRFDVRAFWTKWRVG